MPDRIRRLSRWVLTICIVALIIGSLLPVNGIPAQQVNDKMLHFAAYALAGLFASFAFRQTNHRVRCIALLTLLGVALEFCQLMVPGRAFELWDMAANGCGSCAAITALRIVPTG